MGTGSSVAVNYGSSFKMKKKLIRSCDSVKRYFFVSHTHFRALTDCFFARLSFFSLNNCTFYQNCAVDYSIHLQSSDLCSMLYALHAIVIAYIHPVLYTALHTIALQASYKDSYTWSNKSFVAYRQFFSFVENGQC